MRALLLLALLLPFHVVAETQPESSACSTATDCRQLALQAAEREEVETFHTLAWRVVQLSKRNDPDAMRLLARAQSMSGRANDALIMLRRLADMGIGVNEAETSDDYQRVRALPTWPEVLEKIHAASGGKTAARPEASPAKPVAEVTTKPAPPESVKAEASKTEPAATKPAAKSADPKLAEAKAAEAKAKPTKPGAKPAAAASVLAVPSATLRKPVAMAYDGVSRRFVLADDETETLKVLGESASSISDLVRNRWAGDYRTTALAIDTQRGDLWITGTDTTAAGGARSVLHRMQLVSGRLLYSIEMPGELGSVTLTDLVVNGARAVALDSVGLRVVSLASGAKAPQVVAELNGLELPTSVAVATDGTIYVSHKHGIARIAAGARRPTPLKAAKELNLSGLRWLRYQDGALIGVQQRGERGAVLMRFRLDKAGSTVQSIDVLDERRTTTGVLAGDVLYYLTEEPDGSGQMLRRIELK
jgi:hypothetical protein